MCSRAALELLPYLDPGKGKGDKAARHLVDSRLVSYKLIHHPLDNCLNILLLFTGICKLGRINPSRAKIFPEKGTKQRTPVLPSILLNISGENCSSEEQENVHRLISLFVYVFFS